MWYTMNFRRLNMPVTTNQTYAGAVETCDNIKPLRGRSIYDPRPLGYRKQSNVKTVQRQPDGSITFALYSEPAVVWHPDGRVTIYPNPATASRSALIWAVAPSAYSTSGVLMIGDQVVQPGSSGGVTIERTASAWSAVMSTTVPFEVTMIDRPKAAAVRKRFNTAGFWAWARAYNAMVPETRGLDHTFVDGPALANALECADYPAVFSLLPDAEGQTYSPHWRSWYAGPSRAAFARFLSWLYLREGATKVETYSDLTRQQWRNRVAGNRFKNL